MVPARFEGRPLDWDRARAEFGGRVGFGKRGEDQQGAAACRGCRERHGVPARRLERLPDGRALGPRGRSEEHTSELQSLLRISNAVFCLKKNKLIMSTSSPYNFLLSIHQSL